MQTDFLGSFKVEAKLRDKRRFISLLESAGMQVLDYGRLSVQGQPAFSGAYDDGFVSSCLWSAPKDAK